MAGIIFSEPLYRWWYTGHSHPDLQDPRPLDSLIATWNWDNPYDSASKNPRPLFAFDPNTASLLDLKNLGLSEKLARRYIHYREKGGKFAIKRDLGKVYGMDSALIRKLYSFIKLPEKLIWPAKPHLTQTLRVASPPIDLNLADTAQLIKIYGIGPKRAMTLVKYRDRLGGFTSLDQLAEVYVLDSVVIAQLKKKVFIREGFTPRQINLNTASEKELSALPYIKVQLAKTITAYRFQHGKFDSLDQLTHLATIDKTLFQKIKPYLTVKD
jgi:DNA uptake protein ComE-like DNA-binding protein